MVYSSGCPGCLNDPVSTGERVGGKVPESENDFSLRSDQWLESECPLCWFFSPLTYGRPHLDLVARVFCLSQLFS